MGPKIIDFIINTIIISIPEESFIVAFTLIFTGMVDRLKLKKENIISFLIPVLLSACTTGFLRKVLGIGSSLIPFLGIVLIFVSVIIIYKIRNVKKIIQCIAASIIGMIIPGLIQLSYVPVTMSILNMTAADIKKVNLGLFFFSLPERVIEILIILALVFMKNNFIRINPLRIIVRNKQILAIFFSCLVLNLVFVCFFTQVVYVEQILKNLSIIKQILAVGIIIIIPIVNIASVIGIIYLLAYREKSKRMYIVEETKAVSALVSILSRRGNYNQIQDELKEFNQQIKEIDMIK